jgi:tRNA uridine 5-carbamoylmethylation protein Kti12
VSKLVIYRGLPGCGKTYDATCTITDLPRGTAARSNRDDIRARMFHTVYEPSVDRSFEDLVTEAQHATIRTLLTRGVDVFCDDANLYSDHVARLMRLAIDCDAEWWVRDMTHVPLEVCIEQDARRPWACVGREVITLMFEKHSVEGWAPMPVPDPSWGA